MADFTALKTAIQTYIKQNGNEEITGNILQEILLSVVTTLGDGAINDLITALGNEITARQQADGTLQQNITIEATARGNADTALQGLINGVKNNVDNGYVYVGIATPSTTPVAGKVFYLALTAGTYTNFDSTEVSQGINILKYNGSAWSLDAFIGIDDTPTPNSPKLIKSGGTFESVMVNGSAFDISAHFASGGTLATYTDLNAALTALNTLSADYKRGGMSIKFVQSSDNKYVQYRLMNNQWSTNVGDWYNDYISVSKDTQSLKIGENEAGVVAVKTYSPDVVDVLIDAGNNMLEYTTKDNEKVFTGNVRVRGKIINDDIESMEKSVSETELDLTKTIFKNTEGRTQQNPFSIPNNKDWIDLFLDGESHILEGTKKDGTKVFNSDVIVKGVNVLDRTLTNKILNTLDSRWSGSHALNIISVKKDGTGDFQTIQEAINSVNDASVTNQYEIQVYDDFYVNDLTELWKINNPSVHAVDATEFIGLIITKDFVHLRGMNGKRVIYVESPNIDMPSSYFQNVHNIYVQGNCRIENFVFKIKGGRYASHQDRSSNLSGTDSFKTTIYKNIDFIHLGNSMYTHGSGWDATCAQANGVANGQTQFFIGCTWDSYEGETSFYAHTNGEYALPCSVYIINCKYINRQNMTNPSAGMCGIIDRYSCQSNNYYVYNSDLPKFLGKGMSVGSMNDGVGNVPHARGTKSYCSNNIVGHGNKPMLIDLQTYYALSFTTIDINAKIEVIGGTAFNDIWGNEYKNISGEGITGTCIGSNLICNATYSKVHNLAYILGNCAAVNKTLILRITKNGSPIEYTITFDQNYMTSDGSDYTYNTTPAISQDSIISLINNQFSSYFTANIPDNYIFTFDDCKEEIVNSGVAIGIGKTMIRDYSSGCKCWRATIAGERPEGVSMYKIGVNGIGEVALVDKNLFHKYIFGILDAPKGTMYKCSTNGTLVTTNNMQEAVFIAVADGVIAKYN